MLGDCAKINCTQCPKTFFPPPSLVSETSERRHRCVHASHLQEREGIVFQHEALDAPANLLQSGLVLADPGDVLLDHGPTDVPVSVTALLQSADELVDFGPDFISQHSQAVLAVVHAFLDGDGEEAEKRDGRSERR